MGLLDGLFGNSDVKPQLVTLDPMTQQGIEDYKKQAGATTVDQHQQNLNQGVNGPTDYSQVAAQEEKALGGYEPGIGGAIQQRYQNLAGEQIDNLKKTARLKAFDIKANRLGQSAQFQMSQNKIEAENKRRQYEADLANDQARNSALASILGIGAMAAGYALAGPAGGFVGGALGGGGGKGPSGRSVPTA